LEAKPQIIWELAVKGLYVLVETLPLFLMLIFKKMGALELAHLGESWSLEGYVIHRVLVLESAS